MYAAGGGATTLFLRRVFGALLPGTKVLLLSGGVSSLGDLAPDTERWALAA